jgi:sugar lactone lactonase YvrE
MRTRFKKLLAFLVAAALLATPLAAQAKAGPSAVSAEASASFTVWNITGLDKPLSIKPLNHSIYGGIAADSKGNIYISDFGNKRIVKVSASGQFIKAWGDEGTGNGQFRIPCGIAVDSSDNIYVVDYLNANVQKFTSDGVFIKKFGKYGEGNDGFKSPQYIATDALNNIYVTDTIAYKVLKFDSEGNYKTRIGGDVDGGVDGQFKCPTGIDFDSAGNLYVADGYATIGTIQKFDTNLQYVSKFGSPTTPATPENGKFYVIEGMKFDIDNNLYVVDISRVQKFKSDGTFLAKWGSTLGSGAQDQFSEPSDIAIDPYENIYVLDNGNNRIMKKSSGIEPPPSSDPGPSPSPGPNPSPSPGPAATAVTLAAQKTDVRLYGASTGSIVLTASGGDSGTYQYSVNNGAAWQSSGTFTGLKAGTYTALARDAGNSSNVSSAVSVTVGQPKWIGSYYANKLPSKAKTGTALTIKPPKTPKGYAFKSAKYASSKRSVAEADTAGNVTFLKGGKVKLTVTVKYAKGSKTKTVTVTKQITVSQLVASITLSPADVSLKIGKTRKLKAAVNPSSATNRALKWKSSNKKVAVVSNAGVVSAKGKGTAVITCAAQDGSGVSARCTVKVS